jgi:biopolymer transport protein TolQ
MVLYSALALLFLQDEPAAPAAANGGALAEMIHNSGPMALAVLIILLLASIFSWTIMLSKWSAFRKASMQSQRFIRAFRKSTRLSELASVADQFKPSPLVSVFNEIHDEYHRQTAGRGLPRNPVALERAAQTASSEALTSMESRMTWLATIAAIAPFIGLFGTVMGIIDAFYGLGTAEALITTAAGLVVAVPAVVGYNQLTARLREFAARMDDFGRELLNAIENAAMLAPPPAATEERRRTF